MTYPFSCRGANRQEWKRGIDILKELKVMPGPGENEHSAMGLQGVRARYRICRASVACADMRSAWNG